jgi:hypothetical protein
MDDAGDGNEVERVAAMVDLKRVWAKTVEKEYVKCRAQKRVICYSTLISDPLQKKKFQNLF